MRQSRRQSAGGGMRYLDSSKALVSMLDIHGTSRALAVEQLSVLDQAGRAVY